MRVKRFNNKWIMGLILCGAILIVLYIAKLIFPSFVVETAQNERILTLVSGLLALSTSNVEFDVEAL